MSDLTEHRGGRLLANQAIASGMLAAVVLAATALRLFRLGDRSIWFDEAVSWRFLQFPFAEMLQRLTGENYPPLYILVLKAWSCVFGESLCALRGLSVFCAAAATVGIYLFASVAFVPGCDLRAASPSDKAKARWIGLVAAGLFAISTFQIRMAWEMRMYSLGTALVILSSWALMRAMFAPAPSWRPWALYGALATLAAYTHYCALFSIAGQVLFAVGYLVDRHGLRLVEMVAGARFRFLLFGYGILAIGWGPWIPFFLRQRQQVQELWYSHGLDPWAVPAVVYRILVPVQPYGFTWTAGIAVAAACGVILAAILVKGGPGEFHVLCLSVVPLYFCATMSVEGANLLVDRYLAFLQPYLLIAIVVLLGRIPHGLVRNAAAALLLAIGVGAYADYMDVVNIPAYPGGSAAAQYVETHRRPGEPVVVAHPLLYAPLLYYVENRSDWRVYSEGKPFPHYFGPQVLTDAELIRDSGLEAVGSGRVWLVTTSGGWGGETAVPIPSRWRPQGSETRFREAFGLPLDYVVQPYLVEPPGKNGTAVAR